MEKAYSRSSWQTAGLSILPPLFDSSFLREQPLLVFFGFIDIEQRIVYASDSIVGGKECRFTFFLQEIYSESVVGIVYVQQTQYGGSYIHLSAEVLYLSGFDK